MLAAIGLDHQSMLDADEVEDERAERVLTAEFVALQPPSAERRSQAAFCVSHGEAQLTGAAKGHKK